MTTIALALALSLVAAGSRVGCVRVKYHIRCAFCVELLYNNRTEATNTLSQFFRFQLSTRF